MGVRPLESTRLEKGSQLAARVRICIICTMSCVHNLCTVNLKIYIHEYFCYLANEINYYFIDSFVF